MIKVAVIIVCVLCELFLPQLHSTVKMKPRELRLSRAIIDHPEQRRTNVTIDAALSAVARKHSCDMANRNYFDHVNLNGIGANQRVRNAGIDLPNHYSKDIRANNLESLAGGFSTADSALLALLASMGHREHILALSTFYQRQIRIGVGYCHSDESTYVHYWTIIIYEPV